MSEDCKHEWMWRSFRSHKADRWYCADCEKIIDVAAFHDALAADLAQAQARIQELETALQKIDDIPVPAPLERDPDFGREYLDGYGNGIEDCQDIARGALSPNMPEAPERKPRSTVPAADAEGRCVVCGCEFEDPALLTHECPPGFRPPHAPEIDSEFEDANET